MGLTGSNVVPGNPEEQNSYRSELAGISGSLAVLSAVCEKYDITEGATTMALDGQQALLNASSTWPLSPHDSDFDLLTDIRAKIKRLPITLKWLWIEGHQDDYASFHSLTPLAQDNVLADGIDQRSPQPMRPLGACFTPPMVWRRTLVHQHTRQETLQPQLHTTLQPHVGPNIPQLLG